ncbi:MAG: DUF3489 domain-containing protein [Burkholderiaceae bacterium]
MNTNTSAAAVAAKSSTKSASPAKSSKRRMAREPKREKQQPGDKPPAAPKPTDSSDPATKPAVKDPRGPSKIASVVALLERPECATLAEMVEATGWLPHTTRAALTGLKKKGHVITKDKRGDVTCYRIVKVA